MVRIKKQISIILILASLLSLSPNFLYNKNKVLAACPSGCTEKTDNGKTYCINCPVYCDIGVKNFSNKACLPLEKAGKWTCGIKIPTGEAINNSAILAAKMLTEFNGVVNNARVMVDGTIKLLNDYKGWKCQKECENGCYKYYAITKGSLQPGEDGRCPKEINVSLQVFAGEECQQDYTKCKSCEECGERCCWQETYCYDLDKNKIVSCPSNLRKHKEIEKIKCKYCRKVENCEEVCATLLCYGCCGQYFYPIIDAYNGIEESQSALANDVDEGSLPEESKYKRDYILEQLNFARCELSKCWNPAEDYPDILAGKKVGKHLLSCRSVSDLNLFGNDQFFSSVLQVEEDKKETETIWAQLWETPQTWWGWLVAPFTFLGKTIMLTWDVLFDSINDLFTTGKEKGCYPLDYYCCQM